MTEIPTAFPLFPSHDPVVGYFLGKMLKPQPNAPPPEVMLGGTVGDSEFSLTTLWNEDGLEMEGAFSDKAGTDDFLSDLMPKVFLDPTGGFWGAAKEMPVRSVMQVKESIGKENLTGTHSESILAEDAQSQTSKMETSLQAGGKKFHNSLTLYREKRMIPFSDSYMLVPQKGEISIEMEQTAGDGKSISTPQPISISFDKDGGWKIKGEIVTRKEVTDASGQTREEEGREQVEGSYRLLKMPMLGVPYVQVDSKVGQTQAHYFIAPLPMLIKLSGIVSDFLTQKTGKPVFVPPYRALEEARKLPGLQGGSFSGTIPTSPVKAFCDLVQNQGDSDSGSASKAPAA